MKHAALLMLLSFALSCPVTAKPHHADHSHHAHHYRHHDHHYAARTSHHEARTSHHAARASHHAARASHPADQDTAHDTAHASHSGITCEMVRSYVATVGLGQAIAMAKSAGISAAEEQRARQCLAKKI